MSRPSDQSSGDAARASRFRMPRALLWRDSLFYLFISRILQWAIIGATVLWIVLTVRQQWLDFRQGQIHLPLDLLLLSLAVHVVGYFLLAWAWWASLVVLGGGLTAWEAARVWFLGNLTKYIPGKIWIVLARIHLSKRCGVPESRSAASFVVEVLCFGASGLLIFGASLPFQPVRTITHVALALLAIPMLLLLHPGIFNRMAGWALRRIRQPVVHLEVTPRKFLGLLALFAVGWIAIGVGFTIFTAALRPDAMRLVIPLTGFNALSWTLGMILPTPGGFGVREGSLVLLLRDYFSPDMANQLTAATRLLQIIAELIGTGLAVLIAMPGSFRTGRSPHRPDPGVLSEGAGAETASSPSRKNPSARVTRPGGDDP